MWGRRKAHWLSFEQMSSRLVSLPFFVSVLNSRHSLHCFFPLPSPISRAGSRQCCYVSISLLFNASGQRQSRTYAQGNELVQMQRIHQSHMPEKRQLQCQIDFFFKKIFLEIKQLLYISYIHEKHFSPNIFHPPNHGME